MSAPDDPGPLLLDPWLWLATLACALAGAAWGLWFGPSIGETALVGAVALGIMGAVAGLVAGLVAATLRRRGRRQRAEAAAAATARERFVATLNAQAGPDQHHSLDAANPRVLVCNYTREASPAVQAEAVERLRSRLQSTDFSAGEAADAEARSYGFEKWVFRINGETVLERTLR